MSESVRIGTRIFDIWSFTGEVMSDKKWTSTHVSGEGGGGYLHNGTGHSSSVSISSTTTTHDQFILRDKSGKEKSFEFSNMHLAMRVGQTVTVFWAIKHGKTSGPYIAVYNHATDDLTRIFDNIDSFRSSVLWKTYRFIVKTATVLSLLAFFIVVIFGGYSGVRKYWNVAGWAIWAPSLVFVVSLLYEDKVVKKYQTLFTSGIKSVLAKSAK